MNKRLISYKGSISSILLDQSLIDNWIDSINNEKVIILRNVIPVRLINSIIHYLTKVGQSSFPNYHQIDIGAPNFHRINIQDKRSYVKGCFHQFVFYPWNQDIFNFFEIFKKVYHLKNTLSQIEKKSYLKTISDGCTARLAFQFYPSGSGFLNMHRDPIDYHQLAVPVLAMSQKGEDYNSGGLFIETKDGNQINLDDFTNPGDIIFFNANTKHGVKIIDADLTSNWLDFSGRWMLLFAINKLENNPLISNSTDLENTSE